MTTEAYAKVNLTLEVFGRRSDGYHALRSVVQPVGLSDTVTIEPVQDGSISSDSGYGDADLAVKAAKALRAAAIPSALSLPGARISIKKRIPAGGGLGGGGFPQAERQGAHQFHWHGDRQPYRPRYGSPILLGRRADGINALR